MPRPPCPGARGPHRRSHAAAPLTFTPADLATTAEVADHHFQKDITAGAEPGTGTYMVGYGHDEAADELTFGPFDVMVVVAATTAR